MPNYRVPLIPETHEDEHCRNKEKCLGTADPGRLERLLKVLCKLAQRAQREATGYYCGYTFKVQPVSKKLLQNALSTLNHLEANLEEKSAAQVWNRITHRVLRDQQHRCTLRTAPEEWLLASQHDDQDVTNAYLQV